MSTEASEVINAKTPAPVSLTTDAHNAAVPKKIVNAQTVCNVKNEKGKLCNGHLKQLHTGGEDAEVHLRGDDVLFKCQSCGTLYMGPPLGHVRDPDKQARFVQAELTELLQAAGGTMPIIKKNDKGIFVLAEPTAHAPAKPAAAAKPSTPSPQAATAIADESPEEKKAGLIAEVAARKSSANEQTASSAPSATAPAAESKPAAQAHVSLGPIPGASGPVPGETWEQKLARLRGVVAELKRRKEAAGGGEEASAATGTSVAAQPVAKTNPTLASTSGTDSSPSADEHRAEAEAQAATGQASAVPMSAATANASPAAIEEAASNASAAAPKAASSSRDFDTGPVPGETFEQKIERLKAVVAAAKARGDREGRVKP